MTASPGRLEGRVAVVTGGNRGLGKAIAKAIGSAGAKVALVAPPIIGSPFTQESRRMKAGMRSRLMIQEGTAFAR